MSQEWAEKNTCTGLHHDTPDMDTFYAENLAGILIELQFLLQLVRKGPF